MFENILFDFLLKQNLEDYDKVLKGFPHPGDVLRDGP
jgi:hypothetical protein